MSTTSPRSRVAFVLSGGASLGAIQVGMVRALLAHDVRPDMIVATSVGALNGAFLASHGSTPESVDELSSLWRGVRRGHVFPLEPLTGLLGFLGARRNLVPGAGLRRLIARNVMHERLEDLPIPLHVVACDVLSGDEVLLSKGPLAEAVLASAAIPGVFPPVEWEGRLLIDAASSTTHRSGTRSRSAPDGSTSCPRADRARSPRHREVRWRCSCTRPGSCSRSASLPRSPRSPAASTSSCCRRRAPIDV